MGVEVSVLEPETASCPDLRPVSLKFPSAYLNLKRRPAPTWALAGSRPIEAYLNLKRRPAPTTSASVLPDGLAEIILSSVMGCLPQTGNCPAWDFVWVPMPDESVVKPGRGMRLNVQSCLPPRQAA